MADGTHRPIDDIKVGDRVLATDPTTGRTEAKQVTELIVGHGHKQLVQLTVGTDAANGHTTSTITATEGHPFWVASKTQWLTAKDLEPGDLLRTPSGTSLQVRSVRKSARTLTVYNLTVDQLHTYYVAAGDQDILVHNCPASAPSGGDGYIGVHRGPGRSWNYTYKGTHRPVKMPGGRMERAQAAADWSDKFSEVGSDVMGEVVEQVGTSAGHPGAGAAVEPILRAAGAVFGWLYRKGTP
jgi:hypothetical protein